MHWTGHNLRQIIHTLVLMPTTLNSSGMRPQNRLQTRASATLTLLSPLFGPLGYSWSLQWSLAIIKHETTTAFQQLLMSVGLRKTTTRHLAIKWSRRWREMCKIICIMFPINYLSILVHFKAIYYLINTGYKAKRKTFVCVNTETQIKFLVVKGVLEDETSQCNWIWEV